MEETMHLAAQYLATAAISFIDKKADDSHTNLGWENHSMVTHPFPNGDRLGLNYGNFSLEWLSNSGDKETFLLQDRTHQEIVAWVSQISSANLNSQAYNYKLHYDLPYDPINSTTRFDLSDANRLQGLIENRNLAHEVLSQLLVAHNLISDIRIWPHHFDTGAFVVIDEKLSIGLGMAMPDSFINDFYFYVSGYHGHDGVVLTLNNHKYQEHYYDGNWKGFALPVKNLDRAVALDFCQKAMDEYRA